MSFAENLRKIRKEQRLSQEELAEIMDVSRQAISKWELGESYPEVEKLLLLSKKFNISLDRLMSAEIAGEMDSPTGSVTGTIIITSPHENVIASCYKVISSQKMHGGKHAPQYALFGISNSGYSFWGEANTFLGWYADWDSLSQEILDIRDAIAQGTPTYQLKYSVKTKKRFLSISIVD